MAKRKPKDNVARLMEAMEVIAPLEHAAEWDNVGLLIGSADWAASDVLLTIDLTEAVLDEAISARADAVLAYHPPLFEPVRSLTDRHPAQRIALRAASAGLAVYSPHTALDAAPGGVNDWIAGCLGAGRVEALDAAEALPVSEQCKIVTFCPADAAGAIRTALAAAGAGRIGGYEQCSFELSGTGTFRGGPGTDPAIGRSGRLERVDEVRLEMVCAAASLAVAVPALRSAHPYEEPPVEIYRLAPRPLEHVGMGRRVVLDRAVALDELVRRIKRGMGLRWLAVAAATRPQRLIGTVGLCAGAGGSLLETALQRECELFLTGEMRHHDVLAAQARGCTVALAGHTNTERGYLKVLRRRLGQALPDVTFKVSRRDRDPLRVH